MNHHAIELAKDIREQFKLGNPGRAHRIFDDNYGLILDAVLYPETRKRFTIGVYEFYPYDENTLWIGKDDGEGMGLGKESLDKIWKENF